MKSRFSYRILLYNITILFAIIFCNTLSAQTSRSITLQEAIGLAVQNNSDIITARLEMLKAQEKVSEVYRDNLAPNFILNSKYTRNFKKPTFNIFGEQFEIGSDNDISNILEVQYSIPVLGVPVFQGIRVAQYYERLSEENINASIVSVTSQVKKSFYLVLLAKEITEVNRQSLQNSIDNLFVVEMKYRNGVATEFDYLRAQVQVENNKPVYEKSLNDLEVSKLSLKNVIGIEPDETIDVIGDLTYEQEEIRGSLDEILIKIINDNISIRQLELNRLINREIIRVNEANYLPKLALFGQYQLSTSENDDKSFSNWKFNNAVLGGLSLTWDLNILRTSKLVSQSEIELRINDEHIRNVKRQLQVQAESVLLRIENARSRVVSQMESVRLAQRSLDLANTSFREGVVNQLDVLNSELQLSQSKLAYLQAVYDYRIAVSDLEELLEK